MSNTSKIEFPGYNLLSVDEKKCFVAMENLDRDNIWMIAIEMSVRIQMFTGSENW